MCKYCEATPGNGRICRTIPVKKTASKTDIKDCQIFLKNGTDSPGFMIFDDCGKASYVEIEYCPFCGRRLFGAARDSQHKQQIKQLESKVHKLNCKVKELEKDNEQLAAELDVKDNLLKLKNNLSCDCKNKENKDDSRVNSNYNNCGGDMSDEQRMRYWYIMGFLTDMIFSEDIEWIIK